jgi:HKD family nuclease
MIQRKLKLISDLKIELQNCDEIWIAVAMVSDSGFNYIQNHIDNDAKQNFLVGIGLPTSPQVLRQLKELNALDRFNSRVYHKTETLFHPKAYIIRTNDNLIAYVGSGNCTEGGFDKNIELSIKIQDQDFCNGLIEWFNTLYKHSNEITEDFLESYEILFKKRKERMREDRAELKKIFKNESDVFNLDEIDFASQFFKKEHFQAFEGRKPWDESPDAVKQRENVRQKLYKLDRELFPLVESKKWNIDRHYSTGHVVSSAIHSQHTAQDLSAIWLHYGRGMNEIKEYGENQTPLDYMRLQVIIHHNNIGIWNRIGKDRGSQIDRDNLKSNLKNDSGYRIEMFNLIERFPDEYFIQLNNERRFVRTFENENQLADYLLRADYNFYFIIGVEIHPGDSKLSEKNILETIIKSFDLLYPTYELIKHKF